MVTCDCALVTGAYFIVAHERDARDPRFPLILLSFRAAKRGLEQKMTYRERFIVGNPTDRAIPFLVHIETGR